MSAEEQVAIDDSLYSRQRYVLGDGAMQRMARSAVLITGLSGVGVEIAKNVILAGVKRVVVHDTKTCTVSDQGSQFYIRDADVHAHANRAEASVAQLAELNPYVKVEAATQPLEQDDYIFVRQFQCVIACDLPLAQQQKLDELCRSQQPPIAFISCSVRGVFGYLFNDFGPAFEVVDATGEEQSEAFVAEITQANPGVVTTLQHNSNGHGLEDNDMVSFREVEGMSELNQGTFRVKVLTPYKFTICDTSNFGAYTGRGIVTQLVRKSVVHFQSLAEQLLEPSAVTVDLGKLDRPEAIIRAFEALDLFLAQHRRLPYPWNEEEAAQVIAAARILTGKGVDENVVKALANTAAGQLAPLCACLGGWAAQQCLVALTGKFTPIKQFLAVDTLELVPDVASGDRSPALLNDRYDALRICVGNSLVEKLRSQRLFMIGCGAIGCEMLKNYALLGVASNPDGLITITDNDLIEKSNLNRQFLFRPEHIQQPKSTTAAGAAQKINRELHIHADQHKVGPDTAATHYNSAFFSRIDLVVNALDNLAARLFVDSLCVTYLKPLLESGTLGPKGHVQVIVPHMTESYASQRDPADNDIPYCTLKSFPSNMNHAIQWAREKFGNLFEIKPSEYSKFWQENGADWQALVQRLLDGANVEKARLVGKLLERRPTNWAGCVTLARVKFEKYYNHKPRRLLDAFPLSTKLPDGSLFWQSPKRPPEPLQFDVLNQTHMDFVRVTARLLAEVYNVPVPAYNKDEFAQLVVAAAAAVPVYQTKKVDIVTDESVRRADAEKKTQETNLEDHALYAQQISQSLAGLQEPPQLTPRVFEKDDDANGHIDFITAAANLRAMVYKIEVASRLEVKRIAGKIVPAIATTTAAVAGLVSIELLKIVKKSVLADYKNTFLNMAIPFMIFSEPGAAPRTKSFGDRTFTLWDKWEIRGTPDFTLSQFLEETEKKFGFKPAAVMDGAAIVYMGMLPNAAKKLGKPMQKLLKAKDAEYIDLIVTTTDESGQAAEGASAADESLPLIRYYFQ